MTQTNTLSFSQNLCLFAVIFLVIFNYTLTNMAAPYIAGDIGASNDIATYTITFFAIGNALGLPLARYLSAFFGTKRELFIALMLFAITSFLCTLPTHYPLFTATRFLQGLSSGPLFPLVSRLLFSLNPVEKKPKIVTLIVMVSAVSPAIGASWGGVIAYEWDWRVFFYINIPILVFLAFYFKRQLKNFEIEVPTYSLNPVGYISYAIAVFCLCFVITTGQEFDWFRSELINTLLVVGVISAVFYLLWDRLHPHPILDLSLFKIPRFAIAMISLALLFAIYFGMVLLLALWLKLYAQYTPEWIAILIIHMVLATVFLTYYLDNVLFKKLDPRVVLLIALFFFAISNFYTSLFDIDINFGRISFSRILAGLGLACFLSPLFRLSFDGLTEQKTADAIVLFQVVRSLASGLGAAIFTTMWQRRQVFYHSRLGEKITVFSEETKEFFAKANQIHLEGLASQEQLNIYLDRQASSLGLNDSFYFMGWMTIALFFIILLTYFKKNFVEASTSCTVKE